MQRTASYYADIDIHWATTVKGSYPGAPLTYFNDGRGGGGVRVIFLGSEILAKGDVWGSMKDTGIFLGREKKNEGIF